MNEIVVTQKGGEISCDFDSIKNYLEGQLSIYKGIIFTEDTKADAKKTRADLNAEKTAFAKRVSEVRKEYMKPYEDFIAKADEITALFDEPIRCIDEQIRDFDAKRVAEKKERIKEIYNELVPEEYLTEIIKLDRIYNPKWENATFTEKAIREEIMDYKTKTRSALEVINSMRSDVTEQAINIFAQTFDVTGAIKYINDYEENKRQILAKEEERKTRELEERIRREERDRIKAEEDKARAVEEAKAEVVESFIPENKGESEKNYLYRITMTPSAKEALETYMNSIGIDFCEC